MLDVNQILMLKSQSRASLANPFPNGLGGWGGWGWFVVAGRMFHLDHARRTPAISSNLCDPKTGFSPGGGAANRAGNVGAFQPVFDERWAGRDRRCRRTLPIRPTRFLQLSRRLGQRSLRPIFSNRHKASIPCRRKIQSPMAGPTRWLIPPRKRRSARTCAKFTPPTDGHQIEVDFLTTRGCVFQR